MSESDKSLDENLATKGPNEIGNQRLTAGLIPDLAYKKLIKIKDKKLENIKFLVTHIKQTDQEFYKILSDHSTEKSKGDDALESDAEEYE
ncbi:hypothetical protein ILUMI_00497 [Ignelater luminosus]|uniref:Uncharacterized protein n=1 Tax=Ignelater luminosus TaxID=2038154 RepID=A0A8K0DLR5_IGNLU|nr:hypothetical protein ILUMI_00497 [Ignelater luminosus]